MTQTLAGIRVLDFGRYISAPYCGALLADLGAEVIRIERPGGGDDRFTMPVAPGGEGAMYIQLGRNKRSLTLDIEHSDAKPLLADLIRSADVVIVNFPPQVLRELRLDYASLKALRRDIILTSISAYGEGPFEDSPGFDGTGQALSGAMALTGQPQQPYRSAVSYVDYSTGLSAAFGTVTALLARRQTGEGDHVRSSLLGTALMFTNPMLIETTSGVRTRVASGNRSPISGPSDLFATRDGWIMIQVLGQAMFKRWALLMQRPDLLQDPRFADDMSRGENGAVLSDIAAAWCASRSDEDALQILRTHRIPAVPILDPDEVLAAPQVRGGQCLSMQHYPGITAPIPIVRSPARFESAGDREPRPAPPLGRDTTDILAELGLGADDIQRLRSAQVI